MPLLRSSISRASSLVRHRPRLPDQSQSSPGSDPAHPIMSGAGESRLVAPHGRLLMARMPSKASSRSRRRLCLEVPKSSGKRCGLRLLRCRTRSLITTRRGTTLGNRCPREWRERRSFVSQGTAQMVSSIRSPREYTSAQLILVSDQSPSRSPQRSPGTRRKRRFSTVPALSISKEVSPSYPILTTRESSQSCMLQCQRCYRPLLGQGQMHLRALLFRSPAWQPRPIPPSSTD